MHRRRFLKSLSITAASGLSLSAFKATAEQSQSLVILHTNDTHSWLESFPKDHAQFPGLGGAARRAHLVNQIRSQNQNVLLLDSGDVFQGTPYFNMFGGEVEFKVMSAMKYDVGTLGNHDFDGGVDGLVKQMPHASFEFVSANYNVKGSVLEPYIRPYTIKRFGEMKIGIFGLGIEFHGRVLSNLHRGVSYEDPILKARQTVDELKSNNCQFIICLSHLGYRYKKDLVSDINLAHEVPGIDLILGGHSHTFLDRPDHIRHQKNSETMIHQVGWAGIRLGRIDVRFSSLNHPVRQEIGSYLMDRDNMIA